MTARRRKGNRGRNRAAATKQDHKAVRRVTDRAIRRLGLLESLILGAAALAALAGGALAAWLAASAFGLPFRASWAVASLLFFLVPGAVTLLRSRRDLSGFADRGASSGQRRQGPSTHNPADDSGWRNGKD